ncbi:MAG: MBL fold metallo-hydrolase [Calditrichaeota bacterium]|nr:MBL fold metallo-hydrolase [Calditrichota bacterium]
MKIQTIKVGVDNCYLIGEKSQILVDAGMPGKFSNFVKGLEKRHVNPDNIKLIVITHCHWDHIGCAKKIKDLTAAKILVHENEEKFLANGIVVMPPAVTRWGKIFATFLKSLTKNLNLDPCSADIIHRGKNFSLQEYGIEGEVIFTPGHSPGSVSVVLDSGEAFVGDMAMNGHPLTIRPSLPIFAENLEQLKNSWKNLIDRDVKMIYPAHGKPFPIEKLKKKLNF